MSQRDLTKGKLTKKRAKTMWKLSSWTNTQLWPVWLNGWLFVCKLSGSGFESRYSRLNFRYRACFEQGVLWHSSNSRVWVHSETCTWHDKNIQSTIWSICKDHGGPFTSVRELLANTKNFNDKAKIKGILRNEILLCKSMSAKQG